MDNYFDEILLTHYKNSIELTTQSIRWHIALIIMSILSVCFYSINTVINFEENKNWFAVLYIVLTIIWIFLLYFYIKKYKKEKINKKEKIKIYYEQLKIIDYPLYLKEQRTIKLNKIKKSK